MEKLRSTIKTAIIESVSLLLNDYITILICEYSGYAEFITYKFGYPPHDNLFDTRPSSCEQFGFLAGQRVHTIDGDAISLGVAPSTLKQNNARKELYFDLMDRKTLRWRRACYPSWKRAQFIEKGFVLLDGFVNIWGQDFHSFTSNDEWWKDEQYAVHNPLNMPTVLPVLESAAPIPTQSNTAIYDDNDPSLWYWCKNKTLDISFLDKYDTQTSQKIDELDIGRCFVYSNYETKRVYLIIKSAKDMGYQINMDSRYVRRIIQGTAIQRIQFENRNNNNIYTLQDDHNTSHLSWFWEGDEANKNVWNKYDEETCGLINNQQSQSYGHVIPYLLLKTERKFKYEIIRLSKNEGIQRNGYTSFARRIVREDHDDIEIDTMMSSQEYNEELKNELRGSQEENNVEQEIKEEKYEAKDEIDFDRPTSNIATLATEVSIPLTPRTEQKEKEFIKEQTEKQYTKQSIDETQKKMVILPNLDKMEDIDNKSKRERTWRWTKAFMFTGYVMSRSMSLLDLTTDLILLYKAQDNDVILLTIALFISIFSPYVLSYSSGIKLFIFRKTFDHLQGFKKIFLLFYLLPTGFMYFILIDIIDTLFTVYKWFMYNILCRAEKAIKETEELLAQQLGMDRMNWEGFKRQKTVGQLMFETIPQVILQGLIAFNVTGSLLELEGTSISKRDLYLSVGSAVTNSIGQITKLYLESQAVQESFIQYALTCMMGRVGWVPFRHKIQRIFTNKNINTSQKQNQNTILNISNRNISKDPSNPNPAQAQSDIEIIDFNIKYNVPLISRLTEQLGFKYKLQGTIEYDFSTVTIRYLIATLLVLQNVSSDDNDSNNTKNKSIKIQFHNTLRLLGVHDIALLLETCRKKNIVLENVKGIVQWEHAFEISTMKDRKDPRLISYSRDEQGRPLLIGLYLSGYDPDKQILRELLRNDVPINLEDASGETIIYHLIRKTDYAGIRELFKTKYEKDEKRSNIYLNIYNRAGYSPLYLALHQHALEVTQKRMYDEEDKVDGTDEKEAKEEESFAIEEPPSKVRSKVIFKEEKDQWREEKIEEDLHINDAEGDPLLPDVGGTKMIPMATLAPIPTKSDPVLDDDIEATTAVPMAPMAPIPTAPMAPITTAPMAPNAMKEEHNDLYKLKLSHSEPQQKAKSASRIKMAPLSLAENIKVQKYTKMWKEGQPMEDIQRQMISKGVPVSLLQRWIDNKKGKKPRKKKKKQRKLLQSLNQEIASSVPRYQSNPIILGKPRSIEKAASESKVTTSTVVTMKKQLQQREDKLRRKEMQKQKKKTQQKNITNSWNDNLIELANTQRFVSETIVNTMRFKLQNDLWNNLSVWFENNDLIRCIYDCIEACEGILISIKCRFLNDYVKMAKLGSTLHLIESKMKSDKYLTQQQRYAFVKAYKLIDHINTNTIATNVYSEVKEEDNIETDHTLQIIKAWYGDNSPAKRYQCGPQKGKDVTDIVRGFVKDNELHLNADKKGQYFNDLFQFGKGWIHSKVVAVQYKYGDSKVQEMVTLARANETVSLHISVASQMKVIPSKAPIPSKEAVPLNCTQDILIATKVKEDLQKRRRRNKFEIFKIIPRIMDAQHMFITKRNRKDVTMKQFMNKWSIQIHFVMDYIKRFEQHCDIKILKQALNLRLSTPDLQIFAPLTGGYREYLFQQQKEQQTLSEIMKIIQEKELEKIEAKLVSFAYDNLKGYYFDYFSDQNDKKESVADDDDDDEYDLDFSDRQWIYQILLNHNSDPNFECYSGGLSPLAYALTQLFDHIYVANDLVSRGAKLQAKEKHMMVNIFVHSAFEQNSEHYLYICMRICRKSDINLSDIVDDNGNNPMHLAVLFSEESNKKKKSINHKFIRQKQRALKALNDCYPEWLAHKNNDDRYPLTIACKFRDIDSTMCLGAIGAAALQKYIKSIVSHREFVMDLIIWVVTLLLTAHSSDKRDDENYDKLMQIELLFTVFEYNVSFKWPSKHQNTNEIIHFSDLKSFSLISYCYDKRLYSVLELLTTEFNILPYLSAQEHLQVQEMQIEIKQFTGQMFVESKKKFENRWQQNILDKIKQDMLLENDFGSPDITDIAAKFISDDGSVYDNDDIDDDDEHEKKKKAVSWIEVIYSTTVEGLSTADFVTDILILRDLWESDNLWWTTFMLSLLIAPYLVCYSALGSLIQHRMNFMFLTMSITHDGNATKCTKKCKWFSFKLLVLLLMTPLCIAYFVIIDIVFMIYVMFATLIFFISCTKWDIGDVMDDWVFKKIFGLNRMQIIGYRRLRTLSQLFFETIPQIFLQLRILWQIEWANKQNEFQINSTAIMWSVGFAVMHLIFEAAIISLDSAASKMKFIHYAIVCLGARLDWIPFSHLFIKKAREIQDIIDKKDYKQAIDVRQEYFEREIDEEINIEAFNYEEIASGLCGFRYKLEFQFSNESMNKLAETLTYLPSPTLPTHHTSNQMLKSLLNSVLLEPLMMDVIIGTESCRNVDIFSVAELYRSTVHRVHLDITNIDMYRVINNSHISKNTDDNKRKMLSLLMEEFINYGELFVVEWLSQKHLGLNREPHSIKSWIILNSLGGVNGIRIDNNIAIEGGKFEILRKYYTEGLVFGLECTLAQIIYKYVHQCLHLALQENTYFYVALFILWYTRSNIYNHSCSLGCCTIKKQLQTIQSNVKSGAKSPKGNDTESSTMRYGGDNKSSYTQSLLNNLHELLPQILEIGDWEMSFRLIECFAVFKVHLEEILLNTLNTKGEIHKKKKAKQKKGKKGMMMRAITTANFDKASNGTLNIDDEYTKNVLGLDFYKLSESIKQSDIDLLQAIIDTSIHKLNAFPLHSFFVKKIEALDALVTDLRMTFEYNKYIWATKKYRNKDICFMGENGKIVDEIHLIGDKETIHISIPMTELQKFLPLIHLGITKLRFNFKNIKTSNDGNDEKKYDDDDNKSDIGQIKLWFINPIETLDKKVSPNTKSNKRIQRLEWNRVYLKNSAITFKTVNDAHFNVSIMDIFGLSMYNRRLIDYGKIEALNLSLSVHNGYSLHCDGIELEIEFIKKGFRKISVADEEKPIHRFCKSNSIKLLNYIIPLNCFDINALNKGRNETPLHVVCSNTIINYDIVELLINNGIKINKQNKDKDTALDIIQKKKKSDVNHSVEQLLIKHKAVFNTQKPKKTNDPRLKEYLNMLKIGVPIWAVIQFMKKKGADRGLIQDIERMQIQSEEDQAADNQQ